MAVDRLADALNKLKLYDRLGKRECIIHSTKLIKNVMSVLKENGYVEDFEEVEIEGKPFLKVFLKGRITDIGVIKPRQPVKYREWVSTESQYLPAYNIGILIASTPKGVISNIQAKKERIGGRMLAYVY